MPQESEAIPFFCPPAPQTPFPSTENRLTPASPVQPLCNLTGNDAFVGDSTRPHAPILAALGVGSLHSCRQRGVWDLERAVCENARNVLRSVQDYVNEREEYRWDDVTFQYGPQEFLYADPYRLVSYATTAEAARRLVTDFADRYTKLQPPTGGQFQLIRQGSSDVGCELVELGANTILSPDSFALHYGNGALEWHQLYMEKLHSKNSGLSIFEGEPGTGKTFYLRHLMGVLKETHRFYFIPASTMSVLSKPEFIGFWAQQRRLFSKHKFVVVLEDSDSALMTRGMDNRDQVSAILNLSDGMLADFLRLQIICTINCTADDVDQALVRPGRLLCHRVFGRLDYPEAVRLAESLGGTLPYAGDYSIAEVYAGQDSGRNKRQQIGFAA